MTDPRKRTSALVTAAIIVLVLALPGSRSVLEGRLATHVLIQMPLLVLSGWLVGQAWSSGVERWMRCWNAGGIPGLLAVMFVVLFWMLPRSVDGAIQQAHLETAKFISLPLAGVLFALSFSRAPPLLKGAIKANAISMCLVLAWVYHAAPVRLCTSYLASDQQHLGTGFALWAAALSIVWGTPLMFGPRRRSINGGMLATIPTWLRVGRLGSNAISLRASANRRAPLDRHVASHGDGALSEVRSIEPGVDQDRLAGLCKGPRTSKGVADVGRPLYENGRRRLVRRLPSSYCGV